MLSMVQLECFVAVAEELHFGQAAARLRMTQPPLSRQIQQLERELDTRLFERTSRRVQLTEAGRTLLPSARRIIDLAAKATADVRSVGTGASGTLTVSYTAMAGQTVLPAFLRRAGRELPGATLLLRELVTTDQMEEIEKGTVDIGLLRPIVERPGVQLRPLVDEKLVLAVPSDSRLAELADPIFLSDTSDQPLLMYSPGGARYFHDLLLSMFVRAGVHPRIVQYAGQVPALLALVSAGLGFTLVPASARVLPIEGVTFRSLSADDKSDDVNRVQLDVAWSSESTNPLLAEALRILDETRDAAAAPTAIDASGA
jgi:DNA-binding transcriptional LysR family regulator